MEIRTICVLGLGYIGLPTASTLAAHGVTVIGVDVNPEIVETLRRGEIHIKEQGLREMYRSGLASGNLKISNQPAEADAFLIAVPTPFQEDTFGEYEGRRYKLADMSAVIAAAQSIVPVLRKGNLVVLESTSPPRSTIDLIGPILSRSGLEAGRDFHLAYSPERVLPGQILRELTENARVVGGITPDSARAAANLYSIFVQGEIVETDCTTAEFVKLMENSYRDTNIAIANEFSRIADKLGVDVWEAISLANRHPRVNILSPGPGVGGHCISVDPWFLVEGAPEITPLIASARRVNDSQPAFLVDLVRRALGSLRGRRIAGLGLAYKPDVDDVRESPAAHVVRLLEQDGATVKVWEPHKMNAQVPGIIMAASLETALSDAEAIVLMVAHREFLRMSANEVGKVTPARIVVDGVNGWKAGEWRAAGFKVYRLGAADH